MNFETIMKKFDAMSFGVGVIITFVGMIFFQLATNDRVEVNVESVRWVAPPIYNHKPEGPIVKRSPIRKRIADSSIERKSTELDTEKTETEKKKETKE